MSGKKARKALLRNRKKAALQSTCKESGSPSYSAAFSFEIEEVDNTNSSRSYKSPLKTPVSTASGSKRRDSENTNGGAKKRSKTSMQQQKSNHFEVTIKSTKKKGKKQVLSTTLPSPIERMSRSKSLLVSENNKGNDSTYEIVQTDDVHLLMFEDKENYKDLTENEKSGRWLRSSTKRSTIIAEKRKVFDHSRKAKREGSDSETISFVTVRKHQEFSENNDLNLPNDEIYGDVKKTSSNNDLVPDRDQHDVNSNPGSATVGGETNMFEVSGDQDLFKLVLNSANRDLPDIISETGESVLLSDTFAKNKISVAPRLTRSSTFTKEDGIDTPNIKNKKTDRKKWSQSTMSVFDDGNDRADFKSEPNLFTNISAIVDRRSTFTKDDVKAPMLKKKSSIRKQWSQCEENETYKSSKIKDQSVILDNTSASPETSSDYYKGTTKRNTCLEEGDIESSGTNKRQSVRKRWSQCEEVQTLKNREMDPNQSLAGRKSVGRRWDQIEKTPLISKVSGPKTVSKTASKANKSVSFWITSPTNSNKMPKKETLAKKSVKITSPLSTPTGKTRSPLVMRKTPAAKLHMQDSSILAGNFKASKSPILPSTSAISTPFRANKENKSTKEILKTKDKSVGDKTAKKTSKVKVPNFQKIHERQFEKMESIIDLQERKTIRAKNLLSGTKPLFKHSISKDPFKESRKALFSPSTTINDSLSKPVQAKIDKCSSSTKVNINLKQEAPPGKSAVPRLISKPIQHMLTNKIIIKEQKQPKSQAVSRFGFKMTANKSATKQEQIEAIVSKSKLAISRKVLNRNHLANVRTNRRFELLMQMRANEGKKK
ncbi:muscle M-line assembly protein unc-89-like [Euwallacea fornicatus]|uniref:muscle M-line assembly protein unc-89-like n=1 Tax=Euwallacea fornicatus TaxID=995702 RepID=UPI0033901AF3